MPTGSVSGVLYEISEPSYATGFRYILSRLSFPHKGMPILTILQLPAREIYDEQTFWLLAGVAVRLGLRLTGQTARDSPSDSVYVSQLRRRLWRQIVWIDGRSHHHIGLRPLFHDVAAFPLPENLNDVDLNPHMEEMPLIHKGPTEMTCKYIRLWYRHIHSITDTCELSLSLPIRGWRIHGSTRKHVSRSCRPCAG